jgi:hypothetical protein
MSKVPEFIDNREIMTLVITNQPNYFKYASKALKNDEKIASLAVSENGLMLEFVSERLQKDKKIVFEAVDSNCISFKFADPSIHKDIDFIMSLNITNDFVNLYINQIENMRKPCLFDIDVRIINKVLASEPPFGQLLDQEETERVFKKCFNASIISSHFNRTGSMNTFISALESGNLDYIYDTEYNPYDLIRAIVDHEEKGFGTNFCIDFLAIKRIKEILPALEDIYGELDSITINKMDELNNFGLPKSYSFIRMSDNTYVTTYLG